MKPSTAVLLTALFIQYSDAIAAISPCDQPTPGKECKLGDGGWKQVAVQYYDGNSPKLTIWEMSGIRMLCTEPGPKTCVNYGGDLEAFKADALREEKLRSERKKKFDAYQDALDKRYQEYNKLRGKGLKEAGWKEIARCDDGHTWKYVLEKSGDYLACEGINALGGPEERPCIPFEEDLEKFKKKESEAKAYKDEYEKASQSGQVDKFLAKKRKDNAIPNCW